MNRITASNTEAAPKTVASKAKETPLAINVKKSTWIDAAHMFTSRFTVAKLPLKSATSKKQARHRIENIRSVL
jgi:DTW domain-containing protein YfiP